MRLLLGLAAVFVLAGCGAATGGSGPAAPPSAAQAPPIVAIDEAPPPEVARMLDELSQPLPSGGPDSSVDVVTFGAGGTSTTPSPQQKADALARIESERAATAPSPGSPPRAVARLPLAEGGDALFVTWRNRAGALCSTTWISRENGGGGGAGCDDDAFRPCTAICIESSAGVSSGSDEVHVLSGTVSGDADAIDVTTADGTTTEYPLTGPVVDGDRRVFLLELGVQDWRKLVLVRDGDAVAETDRPKMEIASEECAKTVPSPPGPTVGAPFHVPSLTPYTDAMNACMAAHGAGPTP